MYQAPIFSILWVGRTTSEHSFRVHVLYFKKQLIPPPCCLAFYTEYNIHERHQINSLREHCPLCAEQLLDGSPSHLPQARASNLFWGNCFRGCGSNGAVTSLQFPTSLLTLSVCDNCAGDLEVHSPCWELACEPFNACHWGHSMSAIWCWLFSTVALYSNWYLELLLAVLDLPGHPYDCFLRRCFVTCWITTSRSAVSLLRASWLAAWWYYDSLSWCFVAC